MALVKLKDIADNSQELVITEDAIAFDKFEVYTGVGDRVGTVQDVLVDDQADRFRYLIVDTGFWIFGKQVIIPMGLVRFDYQAQRVYIDGLKKVQIERLPEFKSDRPLTQDYEELVRKVLRPMVVQRGAQSNTLFDRTTYSYEQDAALYTLAVDDQQFNKYENLLGEQKAHSSPSA